MSKLSWPIHVVNIFTMDKTSWTHSMYIDLAPRTSDGKEVLHTNEMSSQQREFELQRGATSVHLQRSSCTYLDPHY